MNTHAEKKEKNKSQSAANAITKKQSGNASTFQFVDNRPEAVTQRKLQEIANDNAKNKLSESVWETPKSTAQLKLIEQSSIANVVQLGRKRKKPDDDSGDEYLPPSKRRKHRHTFSKKLRNKVIKKGTLKNKSGLYVCPGCGMPLADKKGKEIKTYYISKSKKRHNIVSGQLDHYPPWSKRLKKLEKQKKSEEVIKEDHNDPTRLRPLCLRCNASHKFENTKDLPESGFSDEEYYSDNEARDKEIWEKYRKDDKDPPSGGAGITT